VEAECSCFGGVAGWYVIQFYTFHKAIKLPPNPAREVPEMGECGN